MTSRTAVARSYLLVCFASLTALAGDCPEHEPPPLYDVASVELIPPNLHVLAGSVFELSVRLRDSYDRTLPVSFSYEVEWTVSDDAWLDVLSSTGHVAQLKALQPSAATIPTVVSVQVKVLDRAATGSVTVIPQNFVADGELILTNHNDGDAPSMLLADGQRGTFLHDEAAAFVGATLLQDFTTGTTESELAFFSISDELGFISPVPWVTGPGIVNLTGTATTFPGPPVVTQSPSTRRKLNIRIWNAAGLLPAEVDERVKYLDDVLKRNRAGIVLNVLATHDLGPISAPMSPCATPIAWLGSDFGAYANDIVLHLVLVASLEDAGKTCLDPGGLKGRVILKAGTIGPDQGLAHELGHALSLNAPLIGHTNGLAGFDTTNFMVGSGSNRLYYSLGQLFRMTVDDSSWLNLSSSRPGRLERDCGPTITGPRPCPRLSTSFSPIGP